MGPNEFGLLAEDLGARAQCLVMRAAKGSKGGMKFRV